MSDPRAPAVVAVVVTRDPGSWFDEVLASLAAQDYQELSVLVLVSGGEQDPTGRVARALPEAFVRRLPEDRGYAAAANLALEMVEGAAFYLLLHDDCALAPDALHLMVEESFRSNAGIVSPKMAHWDDRSALLRVGMNADKTGAMVDRVQDGEVDHGQHDVVRDVFVAPGGCTLVRADLFRELGGFDAGIVALGEDLDLSWRAQVAGGRVVVAPAARVRHLQELAGGGRPVAAPPEGQSPSTLQQLQRRHELRAVLKCYSWFHLLRVLPQIILLSIAEVVLALAIGDRDRVRAVLGAWRWNLRRRRELRRLRAEVRAHRTVPDRQIRHLQTRGSARLSTYLSRLVYQGVDVANARVPAWAGAGGAAEVDEEPVLTGSVGTAFSEDADFDELDDLGHRSGRDRFGRRRRRPVLSTAPGRLAVVAVVVVILLLGSRNLVAGHLPLVGQFAPLGSWSATWHQFFAGWQPAGLGTTAPSTPSFAFLGVVGTILLGGMGLVQKVLVLGCLPVGAWGVSRLLRPIAAPRARLIGAVCYLALPLPYDALARGRWDGLVAYALTPWIVLRLARATGIAPYSADPTPTRPPGGPWRRTLLGQSVTLGALEAVAVAFAPAMAVVVLLAALGIVLGSLVVGQANESGRAVRVALGSTAVTVVLCAPWMIGTALAGTSAVGIFGLAGAPMSAPNWGALLRFDVGPTGASPLSWFLLVAAFLPLLIGRRARLAWAGRLWTVACLSWLLALIVSRGWSGSFAPVVDVLLAPAAVAVATAVGLGVASFETDLSGYRFGLAPGGGGPGRGGGHPRRGADGGRCRQRALGAPGPGLRAGGELRQRAAPARAPTGSCGSATPRRPAHRRLVDRARPGVRHLGGRHAGHRRPLGAGRSRGRLDHRPGHDHGHRRRHQPAGAAAGADVDPLRGGGELARPLDPGHPAARDPGPADQPPAGAAHPERPARGARRRGLHGVREHPVRPGPGRVCSGGSSTTTSVPGGCYPVLPGPAGADSLLGPVSDGDGVRRLRAVGWLVLDHRRPDGRPDSAFGWAASFAGGDGRDRSAELRRLAVAPAVGPPRAAGVVGPRRRRPGSAPLDRLVAAPVEPDRTERPRRARAGGVSMRPTPRHRGTVSEARRVPLLVALVVFLVGIGLVAHFAGRQAAPSASSGPGSVSGGTAAASSIAPVAAQSSSWYCTGGTGTAGGTAQPVIYLVNSTDHTVTGTMTVVTDGGASGKLALSVPARQQIGVIPTQVEQGSWLAARVDLAGGGVSVTEAVSGPAGWSEAPCASAIAPNWYFASGSTAPGSDAVRVAVQPDGHRGGGQPVLRLRGQPGPTAAVPGAGAATGPAGGGRRRLLRPGPAVGVDHRPGPVGPGGGGRAPGGDGVLGQAVSRCGSGPRPRSGSGPSPAR